MYIELAFVGVELSAQHLCMVHHDSHIVLQRMELEKPLVYDEGEGQMVVTRIMLSKDQGPSFVPQRALHGHEQLVLPQQQLAPQ
jgi:hypothetical protein